MTTVRMVSGAFYCIRRGEKLSLLTPPSLLCLLDLAVMEQRFVHDGTRQSTSFVESDFFRAAALDKAALQQLKGGVAAVVLVLR